MTKKVNNEKEKNGVSVDEVPTKTSDKLPLQHINNTGAITLAQALAVVKIEVTPKTAAIIYEVVLGFIVQGDQLSLKTLSNIVNVVNSANFEQIKKEK